jgi:hypothetical protein
MYVEVRQNLPPLVDSYRARKKKTIWKSCMSAYLIHNISIYEGHGEVFGFVKKTRNCGIKKMYLLHISPPP